MIGLYNPDVIITRFGAVEIPKDYYETLKRNTKTFPFVNTKKWTAKLQEDNDSYKLLVFATGMEVTKKFVNSDTDEVKLLIAYYNGLETVSRVFDSTILSAFGAKELFLYGIRFDELSVGFVTQYLILSESVAQVQLSYSKLGWTIRQDQILFRSGTAFSEKGIADDCIYGGQFDFTPCGSLDAWLEMVRNEVLCSVPMTVALLIGFASPLLQWLNNVFDLGSILFNFNNHSSSGKSTAGMLAASVFSNPILNMGTMISYNATENALVEFVSNCQGHTVVLDEVAISSSKDFSKMMYTICSGRSKLRLSPDGTSKPVKKFSSFIISTAEFSIISNTMDGIKVRAFEIQDSFSTSAQNSDTIKEIVLKNHAVAAESFIKYLFSKIDNIHNDYLKEKQYLLEKCADVRKLTERIISKFAVLTLTAKYVDEVYDFNLNFDAIYDYFINLESSISVDTDSADRLLQVVLQEVTKNYKNFKKPDYVSPSNCLGAMVEYDDEHMEIRIIQSAFDKIVKEHGITDYASSLRILKKRGMLLTESDRLHKRIVIESNVGRVNCLCFLVPKKKSEEYKPSIPDPVPPEFDVLAQMVSEEIDLSDLEDE